ncbi:hypothetical protein WDU94_002730 [Cyamophila willieti]
MMFETKLWLPYFVSNLIFHLIFLQENLVEVAANYPLLKNDKPCAQKKATINYVGPLCIPDGEKWRPDSETNCLTVFKDQCPEFNQAECLWYPWKPSDPSLNVPELQIPCCRLKYYARGNGVSRYTWMEVLYTNQYGTSDRNSTVFDVVEIHRLIKRHKTFGDVDMPDWPGSVLDPNGERGVTWVDLKNLTKPLTLNASQICPDTKGDPVCSGQILDYLIANYKEGFEPNKLPVLSDLEKGRDATITYEYLPSCSLALVGGLKTSVCKVRYMRHTVFEYKRRVGKRRDKETANINIPYLEAQIFIPSNGSKDPLVRYAYLNFDAYDLREPSDD